MQLQIVGKRLGTPGRLASVQIFLPSLVTVYYVRWRSYGTSVKVPLASCCLLLSQLPCTFEP